EDADVGEQLVGQGGADLLGVGEDAAALALGDGLDDGAGQLDVLAGDEADLLGEGAGGRHVAAAAGDDEQGLDGLYLVAGLQHPLGDGLAVDIGAVGAADVAEEVALALVAGALDEFGVAARHLGVVEADGVALDAADADDRLGQLELLALV